MQTFYVSNVYYLRPVLFTACQFNNEYHNDGLEVLRLALSSIKNGGNRAFCPQIIALKKLMKFKSYKMFKFHRFIN